jgi:hypothetical protein
MYCTDNTTCKRNITEDEVHLNAQFSVASKIYKGQRCYHFFIECHFSSESASNQISLAPRLKTATTKASILHHHLPYAATLAGEPHLLLLLHQFTVPSLSSFIRWMNARLVTPSPPQRNFQLAFCVQFLPQSAKDWLADARHVHVVDERLRVTYRRPSDDQLRAERKFQFPTPDCSRSVESTERLISMCLWMSDVSKFPYTVII